MKHVPKKNIKALYDMVHKLRHTRQELYQVIERLRPLLDDELKVLAVTEDIISSCTYLMQATVTLDVFANKQHMLSERKYNQSKKAA